MTTPGKDIPEIPPDCSTGPHRVVLDKWIECAPFERLLNMEIKSAENGKAVLTMPFCRRYAQGAGLMHGGALVSLADTAVVMAIKSLLEPWSHFATIEMESKFLYPVKQGQVTARAEITEKKDRTIRGEATVYNEEGKAVFSFSSVFKIARDTKIR
ncbi:MAG: PaaI family thioesterase [Desulfobacterales bacterium]